MTTMSNSATRYREIEVSGPPRELGRQIGEAAKEQIRGFVQIALEHVNRTVKISRDKALAVANGCFEFVEQYAPHLLDELRGMAEGSGATAEDLMLLQVRNQFTPDMDAGCTAFAVGREACKEGRVIVAQNWDNDPALDPFTLVLTRRPAGKPALMTVTQAGLISYIGMNDAGIGACVNTLPAPSRPTGVPHYFSLRAIYESASLDGAVEAVRRACRAIPVNIVLATPQGPADLEVTLDRVHVLRGNGSGVVTHTNHCIHPDLAAINDQRPELIQSKPRLRQINRRLNGNQGALDIEQMKAALRDHHDFPTSICRHANDHPLHGFWESVFSVVVDPEAGQMHVARGTPCDHPFEVYRMN